MKVFRYQFYLLLIASISLLSSCANDQMKIIPKNISSTHDIVDIDSNLVIPYDYKNVVSLKELSVKDKKRKFIDLVLPGILVSKYQLKTLQKKVNQLINKDTANLSANKKAFLQNLLVKYKAKNFPELLSKLNTHPTSIVLAQSAIESGWGTSRFFLEANNIFGVWSFQKTDDRIKAQQSRQGKATYLKKYPSISASIEGYFETLARGPYKEFRKQREATQNPYVLIKYLNNYSELGLEYVEQIRLVIKKNNLRQYDSYSIDPDYLP
ncbi:MAG: hypothetical protein B7C24_05575 [Bacteroidetes bacterium 4572_77]|nr:MAG: hypothetical protein B7C24_05575 [Bacteroidetes bacterium 4572_77]